MDKKLLSIPEYAAKIGKTPILRLRRYSAMTNLEWNKRLREIIDDLNGMEADKEDLPICGATDVEMALDFIRDGCAEEHDGEYNITDAELEKIQETCEKNLKKIMEMEGKKNDLFREYEDLTGITPHYSFATNRYVRSLYCEHRQPEEAIDGQ